MVRVTHNPQRRRFTRGLLRFIRNVASDAHIQQHVDNGRFSDKDEAMDYVLGPFPWLISCIWEAVEEEALSDPGGDLASSELGRIVGHAAAGALKRESSPTPTADLAAAGEITAL